MSTVKIDGRHISAARDLLKMTQDELAEAAGVSRESIWNIENHKTSARASTLEKIREALERRGIEFMNGDRPGVRLHPDQAIYPV
jgi:transcriptional regulator with XRE-family HTH domain